MYGFKAMCLFACCLLLASALTADANAAAAGAAAEIDVRSCIAQNWPACYTNAGVKLAEIVWRLHNWSSGTCVQLGPYQCRAQLKGRVRKLKWVWDGRFTCPSLTGVAGGSRGKKSKTGAIEHAIKDFFVQVSSGNHLTAEQWRQISVGPTKC